MKYIPLDNLEIYQLSRKLSEIGWVIYSGLGWEDKKTMGSQFIRATDSVGANIAEGYGRFHYLDQIKFYYNSRGSLNECNDYWIELLKERGKISSANYKKYKEVAGNLLVKLNRFIKAVYRVKDRE